jgi:hypothetical protein
LISKRVNSEQNRHVVLTVPFLGPLWRVFVAWWNYSVHILVSHYDIIPISLICLFWFWVYNWEPLSFSPVSDALLKFYLFLLQALWDFVCISFSIVWFFWNFLLTGTLLGKLLRNSRSARLQLIHFIMETGVLSSPLVYLFTTWNFYLALTVAPFFYLIYCDNPLLIRSHNFPPCLPHRWYTFWQIYTLLSILFNWQYGRLLILSI